MTSLSTMVLKSSGKVAKAVLLPQWNWIIGTDVNENSRIFIGNKVGRMYIWMSRAAVLGFLVAIHSPAVTTLKHVQKHIKDIIQARIDFYQDGNEIGYASLLQFNRFLNSSWDVFFDMVMMTITMTTSLANILTGLAGLAGDGARSITHELAISFENILVRYSLTAGKTTAATSLGSLGYFAGIYIFSFLERKVVGILAASSEYVHHNRTPILTDDNIERLLIVAGENPLIAGDSPLTTELLTFKRKYEFTANETDIDSQFQIELEDSSWKSFLQGDSRLGDAIRAAKLYLEQSGKRYLIRNTPENERPSVNSGVRRRGGRGRAKSRSRMKDCAGSNPNGSPCRNKTSNKYCRIHSRGVQSKKNRFADKTLLVF